MQELSSLIDVQDLASNILVSSKKRSHVESQSRGLAQYRWVASHSDRLSSLDGQSWHLWAVHPHRVEGSGWNYIGWMYLKSLLLKRQWSIIVRIEKSHQVVAFELSGALVMVVSQKGQNFSGANFIVGVAVNSLECCMRREVSNVAKTLSKALTSALTISNSNQELF